MAYGEAAIGRRRCAATRRDGQPCRAWACWDDPEQRCAIHAGRGHRGPLASRWAQPRRRANCPPCDCAAYGWPHRPGGGLCRWPDPPHATSPTPPGARRYTMRRRWRGARLVYERR